MSDFLRQEFLARQRILYPHLFPSSSKQQRYQESFSRHPKYLSTGAAELEFKDSREMKSPPVMTQQELRLFGQYLRFNGSRATINFEDWKFYTSVQSNCVTIRTQASEVRIKTRDSIVCCKFHVPSPVMSRYYFGVVKHIARNKLDGAEALVCVRWFKNLNPDGCVSEDQRAGLEVVPCGEMRQDQMWTEVSCLELQNHVVVGDVNNRHEHFLVAVQI